MFYLRYSYVQSTISVLLFLLDFVSDIFPLPLIYCYTSEFLVPNVWRVVSVTMQGRQFPHLCYGFYLDSDIRNAVHCIFRAANITTARDKFSD